MSHGTSLISANQFRISFKVVSSYFVCVCKFFDEFDINVVSFILDFVF